MPDPALCWRHANMKRVHAWNVGQSLSGRAVSLAGYGGLISWESSITPARSRSDSKGCRDQGMWGSRETEGIHGSMDQWGYRGRPRDQWINRITGSMHPWRTGSIDQYIDGFRRSKGPWGSTEGINGSKNGSNNSMNQWVYGSKGPRDQ